MPTAQIVYLQAVAGDAFEAMTQTVVAVFAEECKAAAWLHSACHVRHRFFRGNPLMAPTLTLPDAAFASAMSHHRVRLAQVPPGALVVACTCAERLAPPLADHTMVCKCRTKGADVAP
jgi:hypothetical protein